MVIRWLKVQEYIEYSKFLMEGGRLIEGGMLIILGNYNSMLMLVKMLGTNSVLYCNS